MMVASYFVQKAHDRSLLDDAYLISSRVLEIDEYNERKIKPTNKEHTKIKNIATLFFIE